MLDLVGPDESSAVPPLVRDARDDDVDAITRIQNALIATTTVCARASAAGVHVVVAAIDGDNEAAIRFHERLGFALVGRLPEVGWGHGRWLDLVLMQRRLPPGSPPTP